jgi:hypothetical protein
MSFFSAGEKLRHIGVDGRRYSPSPTRAEVEGSVRQIDNRSSCQLHLEQQGFSSADEGVLKDFSTIAINIMLIASYLFFGLDLVVWAEGIKRIVSLSRLAHE